VDCQLGSKDLLVGIRLERGRVKVKIVGKGKGGSRDKGDGENEWGGEEYGFDVECFGGR